jgi:hypothetical protein
MKRSSFFVPVLVIVISLAANVVLFSGEGDKPFGGEKDIEFAKATWEAIKGHENWIIKSDFYVGNSPHGKFLRTYFSLVNIGGKTYHVVIKDNYGGEGATLETVGKRPDKYLVAVTVMVQRENGYDPEDNNWFWAKYKPDGSLDKNEKGMQLAGRVAKGMNAGCISCHSAAQGKDFFFTNDK